MSAVLFWILFSLVLLAISPDPWKARRELAKRLAEVRRKTRRARSRAESE
ncbi:MAG TPA: hypothetical protein VNU96_14860 [Burkholderiales bacterium]|jgi:hypothetical protein|nr:hypothetical protein [Burkholderiales bacterium]